MSENSSSIQTDDVSQTEKEYFLEVIKVFGSYKKQCQDKFNKTRRFVNRMSDCHRRKLCKYLDLINDCEDACEHNQAVFDRIVKHGVMFDNVDFLLEKEKSFSIKDDSPRFNIDPRRLNSVLHQIVREWTTFGKEERDMCFGPILKAVDKYFKDNSNKADLHILVPGAGLGRLVFELTLLGYSTEGNEFSPMMLFPSNYILNKLTDQNSETIYPWITSVSNVLNTSDRLKQVTFPDVNPKDVPLGVEFTMSAGCFLDIYSESRWNCIVTCFFLDTSKNILQYIENISKILLKGGYWINIGPLHYHYADMANENSIEPTYEMLREIIESFGLKFLEERTNVSTKYTQNPSSMMQYVYNSVFFVCYKE